ncbi:Hypothetical Protein RradSPS_1152 [Rubrobacter radiotolerans]|uniref:DUF1772 domain-containing protein n=1 Tax=Rubrobacter radiotolerans TaxID=42256 RepID=A0A023X349_RUBRA|nr:hypothetical protein [Rubrobacter radiotolerans]AHY46435.1 Hypothetical Protein RradSPS_1152 [Rubrobacter radiotolerans]MDX5893842.1 hypothetical protein [Rubrobacter radiotolerans]SMC04604.1 signal peptide [Rubrobacter radiotolerans DSM 5868]
MPDLGVALLLANLVATLFMVGVIWFVQIVHYPLFSKVGPEGFVAYAADHSRLTGYVVGPPMLVEAASALGLVVFPPPGISAAALWLGLGLVLVVWLSTALLQVPRHAALGRGFDLPAHRLLVGTNWVRTVAWSARGLLVTGITAALVV